MNTNKSILLLHFSVINFSLWMLIKQTCLFHPKFLWRTPTEEENHDSMSLQRHERYRISSCHIHCPHFFCLHSSLTSVPASRPAQSLCAVMHYEAPAGQWALRAVLHPSESHTYFESSPLYDAGWREATCFFNCFALTFVLADGCSIYNGYVTAEEAHGAQAP